MRCKAEPCNEGESFPAQLGSPEFRCTGNSSEVWRHRLLLKIETIKAGLLTRFAIASTIEPSPNKSSKRSRRSFEMLRPRQLACQRLIPTRSRLVPQNLLASIALLVRPAFLHSQYPRWTERYRPVEVPPKLNWTPRLVAPTSDVVIPGTYSPLPFVATRESSFADHKKIAAASEMPVKVHPCLLYTSDAADE